MSPNPDYRIGKEAGIGTEGNAPVLLWQIWSPFIALVFAYFPSDLAFSIETLVVSFLILPFICLIVLVVFQLYVRRRYRTEFSNQQFEEIIVQSKSRMGYSHKFEIWSYPETKHILIGTAGFLHSALVVSEPTVQDIIANPEEGEIILADALKDLKLYRAISTWGAIVILITITLVFSVLAFMSEIFRAWWPSLIWAIFVFFPSPWVMRYAKERSNEVQNEYNMHPNAARLIVFRGTPPTDREVEKYITQEFGVFDDKSQYRKAIVLFFISAVISIVGGVLVFTFLLGVNHPIFDFLEGFRIAISLLVSVLIFILIYFRLLSILIPELE